MKKYTNLFTSFFAVFILAAVSCNTTKVDFNPTLEEQSIKMDSIANFRQLGGYPIGNKHIRQDVLLRSANLAQASDEDLKRLHDELHTTLLFDFRSTAEHNSMPDKTVENCEYIWLPCLEQVSKVAPSGTPKSGNVRQMADFLFDMLDNQDMRELSSKMYTMIVFDEGVQANYSRFLRELAQLPEGESALWHCSQGKDRTGWGSAFLLACLGANRDLIVKDFALSNEIYKDIIETFVKKARDRGKDEQAISVIYSMIGVNVNLFEETLDMIDKQYGSMEAYLSKALGVDDSLKQSLRRRYLQ